MNPTPYPFNLTESQPLADPLQPWLTLRCYPFQAQIVQYEPWTHKTDTAAYNVYTQQSDIQVGESVFRPAYMRVSLWKGGGTFPLRPTEEELKNKNEAL